MPQKLKEMSMTCKYFRNFHYSAQQAKFQGAREMHKDLLINPFIGFRLDQGCDDEC